MSWRESARRWATSAPRKYSTRPTAVTPSAGTANPALTEGTALILLETPGGLVLLTRPQLQQLVRADLTGLDLVSELLAERRISATTEDAA
jgi:hypothetical protein